MALFRLPTTATPLAAAAAVPRSCQFDSAEQRSQKAIGAVAATVVVSNFHTVAMRRRTGLVCGVLLLVLFTDEATAFSVVPSSPLGGRIWTPETPETEENKSEEAASSTGWSLSEKYLSSITHAKTSVSPLRAFFEEEPEPLPDQRIQDAYRQWCGHHNKTPTEERLCIFATNYLTVEDYHQKNPDASLVLNEFADLSQEEYDAAKKQKPGNLPSTDDNDDDDDKIRRAYRDWCHFFGKKFDSNRLRTFGHNFDAVQEYHRQTGEPLILNEFADLTDAEFRRQYTTRVADVTLYESTLKGDYNQSSGNLAFSPSVPLPFTSSLQEMVALLHSTSNSLNTVATSLDQTTPASSQPQQEQQQPLDGMVLQVLNEHNRTLFDLEESVDELGQVSTQGSRMIQLLSQNQVELSESMVAVQKEMLSLQKELKESLDENRSLKGRLQALEERLMTPSEPTNRKDVATVFAPIVSKPTAFKTRPSPKVDKFAKFDETTGGMKLVSLNPNDVLFKPHERGFYRNRFGDSDVDLTWYADDVDVETPLGSAYSD